MLDAIERDGDWRFDLHLRGAIDVVGAAVIQADALVARAQALAAPEGIVRVFTDEGAALAPLLGTAPDTTMPARPSGEPGTLPEPLSQRELEVLRLLNEGCSNREIAARMVIEVSTAKRHLNNIYAKLGVNSRTQALAQARAHKLL
jgi:LuxR family maltose regulon positive regulatory protein